MVMGQQVLQYIKQSNLSRPAMFCMVMLIGSISLPDSFFVVAQDMIEHKYSHGCKRNKEHLAGDKVMLPVTDSGEPDYRYMEQYAKNMMLRKYQQYLAFLNRSDND